jgi:hypothetical protein
LYILLSCCTSILIWIKIKIRLFIAIIHTIVLKAL